MLTRVERVAGGAVGRDGTLSVDAMPPGAIPLEPEHVKVSEQMIAYHSGNQCGRPRRRGSRRALAVLLAAWAVLLAIPAGSSAGVGGNVFQEADAALPPQETPRWGEEPLEVISSRREQMCLNGIWQFVPMLHARETRPPGGLAYVRVPGPWQSGLLSAHGGR